MNVIKHGTHRAKDSENLYKVTCDSCGCTFEAKRSEFHIWPLPARPVSETVKNYDNTGRTAEIQCPECGCTVSMVPNLELNIMPRNKIFDE